MKAITVSENGEMVVNGTPVSSLDSLGFTYLYLNYEPDNGNLFKFVNNVEGATVRVDLTTAEQASCNTYCDNFVVDEVVFEEPAAAPAAEIVGVRAADGSFAGFKDASTLDVGETALADSVSPPDWGSSVNTPSFTWDESTSSFLPTSYADARLAGYYASINVGDQLDAIWEFISEYQSAGNSIPTKTADALSSIITIKTDNPK
jgi:hypothetical protein